MASTRSDSVAKSQAAHSSLTGVAYGAPQAMWGEPTEHGTETVSFNVRFKLYTVRINFRGRVYSGCDKSEQVARASAFEVASKLTKVFLPDLMTEYYGDYDTLFD